MVKKSQERKDIKKIEGVSQRGARRTVSTTPSSWWEERKRIEQPSPDDQERHYGKEQERYEQDRQRVEGEGKNNMVIKSEGRKDIHTEKKDSFKTFEDSYIAVSKMWEDSYLKLYKPWFESTGEMLEKTALLSKEATPQKYMEFYDEWIKTYQNTFGKFYPIPTLKSNKETLEKFQSSAEEFNKLYRSWIADLEENSRKTNEILQSEPDPAKYKECYDMWIRSYEKIFDDLLELPAQESAKEILGNYMGIPDIYSGSFSQMSKLWKKSFAKLWEPLNESMLKLTEKMAEISRGGSGPEAYYGWIHIRQSMESKSLPWSLLRKCLRILCRAPIFI
jgi:hypothetical protein